MSTPFNNVIDYAILTAEISKATFGMTPSEYKEFKNIRNTLKLDPTKKAMMWENIEENIFSWKKDVRISWADRLKQWEWNTQSHNLSFRNKNMFITIITSLSVLFAGGASFAAESSLPGDMLYGVKLHINESVESAFTFWSEAEAELQLSRIEERIEERNQLETNWELTVELESEIAAQIESHAQDFEKENQSLKNDEEVNQAIATSEVKTSAKLQQRLDGLLEVFNTKSAVYTDVNVESNTDAFSDGNTSTIDSQTDANVSIWVDTENVIDDVVNIGSQAEAEVKTNIDAGIDTATEIEAEIESEIDALIDSSVEAVNDVNLDTDSQVESSNNLDISSDDNQLNTTIDATTSVTNDLNLR